MVGWSVGGLVGWLVGRVAGLFVAHLVGSLPCALSLANEQPIQRWQSSQQHGNSVPCDGTSPRSGGLVGLVGWLVASGLVGWLVGRLGDAMVGWSAGG